MWGRAIVFADGDNYFFRFREKLFRKRLIPLLRKPCNLPLRIDFRVRLDCTGTDQDNWEKEIARLRDLLGRAEPVGFLRFDGIGQLGRYTILSG